MVNLTLPQILEVIARHGGQLCGTQRLVAELNAAPVTGKQNLAEARKRLLIRSSGCKGGRGNLAIHQMTRKGWHAYHQEKEQESHD
jgi:hypothetical protein